MATDELFQEYEEIVDEAVDVLQTDPGEEYTARALLDAMDTDIDTEEYPTYERMLEDRLSTEIDEGDHEDLTYRQTRFPGLTTLYFQDELPETAEAAADRGGVLPTLDLRPEGYDGA